LFPHRVFEVHAQLDDFTLLMFGLDLGVGTHKTGKLNCQQLILEKKEEEEEERRRRRRRRE